VFAKIEQNGPKISIQLNQVRTFKLSIACDARNKALLHITKLMQKLI